MIKKIWGKIRMWIVLQYIGATDDIKKMVIKGMKQVKKEEIAMCNHDHLIKLLPKDFWYQCKKCKMIFFLDGCSGWDLYNFKLFAKKINEVVNKDKNAKKK